MPRGPRSATLSVITTTTPTSEPADPALPTAPDAPPAPEVGRDHALGLHRLLGVTQVLGGVTLTAAYGLGAPALRFDGAAHILVGIGLIQTVVGILWLTRTRALRTAIVRHPGLFVLATLAGGALVMALGGSNKDQLYTTSAQAWLVATGYALPGLRLVPVGLFVTVAAGAGWVLVDGSTGGYLENGDFTPALIQLAAATFAGLWLGRTTGATFGTLNRWHLVELHERGVVGELRDRLRAVDRSAARLSALLTTRTSVEISALRERLRLGVGLAEDGAPTTLSALAEEIAAEYAAAEPGTALAFDLDPAADGAPLAPTTADALVAVIRRQLLNVARHAPDATTVRLAATVGSGTLRVRIEDDGAGRLPFRAGTGTTWSTRQLARVGGSARYYAGDSGVGFEITVPLTATTSLSEIPGLSVRSSLDHFGETMLAVLRNAGYVADSLTAYVAQGDIGDRWIFMPLGCVAIELVLRFGPSHLRLTRDRSYILATVIAVAVTAIFAVPANSPEVLVPATTSVVIPAHLLYVKRRGWWAFFEVFRVVAAIPLLSRYGAAAVELVLIYPIGFSLLVVFLVRYLDRARGLEVTAADGMGRAALAGATVRGLSLHHDAVDVILRSGSDGPAIRSAIDELEAALADLADISSESLDPREVVVTGVQAALVQPVVIGDRLEPESSRLALAGAVDRISLIELAALAADERASCAPPGLLGRRRLRTVQMDWDRDPGADVRLRLTAIPTLRPPDEAAVERLRAVAGTLGVEVDSSPEHLALTYRQL